MAEAHTSSNALENVDRLLAGEGLPEVNAPRNKGSNHSAKQAAVDDLLENALNGMVTDANGRWGPADSSTYKRPEKSEQKIKIKRSEPQELSEQEQSNPATTPADVVATAEQQLPAGMPDANDWPIDEKRHYADPTAEEKVQFDQVYYQLVQQGTELEQAVSEVDWQNLEATNPQQALALRQQVQQKFSELQARHNQLAQVKSDIETRDLLAARTAILNAIPSWENDDVRVVDMAKMARLLHSRGFHPSDIKAALDGYDPRVTLFVYDFLKGNTKSKYSSKPKVKAKSKANRRKPPQRGSKKAHDPIGKVTDLLSEANVL